MDTKVYGFFDAVRSSLPAIRDCIVLVCGYLQIRDFQSIVSLARSESATVDELADALTLWSNPIGEMPVDVLQRFSIVYKNEAVYLLGNDEVPNFGHQVSCYTALRYTENDEPVCSVEVILFDIDGEVTDLTLFLQFHRFEKADKLRPDFIDLRVS